MPKNNFSKKELILHQGLNTQPFNYNSSAQPIHVS